MTHQGTISTPHQNNHSGSSMLTMIGIVCMATTSALIGSILTNKHKKDCNSKTTQHPYNECIGAVLYKMGTSTKDDIRFANEICYPLTKNLKQNA